MVRAAEVAPPRSKRARKSTAAPTTWSFDQRSSTPTLAAAVEEQLDWATVVGQEVRDGTGSRSPHCLTLLLVKCRSTGRVRSVTCASAVLDDVHGTTMPQAVEELPRLTRPDGRIGTLAGSHGARRYESVSYSPYETPLSRRCPIEVGVWTAGEPDLVAGGVQRHDPPTHVKGHVFRYDNNENKRNPIPRIDLAPVDLVPSQTVPNDVPELNGKNSSASIGERISEFVTSNRSVTAVGAGCHMLPALPDPFPPLLMWPGPRSTPTGHQKAPPPFARVELAP